MTYGGARGFCRASFGLVASVAFALLLCSLIVLDLLLTIVTAHCKELQILASCFLLRCCLLALVSFVVMPFTRPTNNSLSAGLDSAPQSSSPSASSNADVPIPPSSVSDSSHPAGGPDVPSPAFLASVVAAVKQALAAEQTATSGQASGSPSTSVAGAIGGVPSTLASSHQSLQNQASAFAASGVGFPPVPRRSLDPFHLHKVGQTFLFHRLCRLCPLVSSVAPSPSSVATGLFSSVPSSLPVPTLPALQQSFVLPPGYSPVPPKLVTQIVTNKFVEFCDLLSKNIEQSQSDTDPQVYFDGRLVLTSAPKKSKRRIEDISSWMEAFSVYCCMLTAHFPNRAKDLLRYQMLILRTYRQFTGRVWLAYDRAFREHAAATNLTDWSEVNIQLFNFHSAGASVRGDAIHIPSEPRGAASSNIICRSWNNGRCVAPAAVCRFTHKCSSCDGQHRASECSVNSRKQSGSAESKRPPPSPPRSRSKSRRS